MANLVAQSPPQKPAKVLDSPLAGPGDALSSNRSRREQRLDAALDATFPASDAFSVDPGAD
jgi:hypothetical protein